MSKSKKSAASAAASSSVPDFTRLEEMVAFMKKVGLSEMEMGEGAGRIRLQLPVAGAPVMTAAAPVSFQPQPQLPAEKPAETVLDGKVITSPMVGTFYKAATPESEPFVKVGEPVKKGQVICIIEAMKTMNQIEAEESGVLAEIMAENAAPVEFGEPLFRITSA